GVPLDGRGLALDPVSGEVGDLDPAREQDRDVAVEEVDDLARVRQQRRNVAGEVGLPAAEPDDERAGVAGRDEQVVVDVGHDQGVGALDRGQGGADGGGEVAAGHGVALLDQVHQHLGVGVRGEDVSPGGQVALQGDVVLDDAV